MIDSFASAFDPGLLKMDGQILKCRPFDYKAFAVSWKVEHMLTN